ncbi:MAG: hypothetical protein C4518_07275 [Desulfobacteraceae bacterium]|nr:MAG: hypothetical protein C4518_07275 [Desulfobacteraceae bacterium]
MDPVTQKIKQWIDEGKDPRIAHWQGGLEAILNVFLPYLEPGKLMPVQPLEEEDLPVFASALELIDLSPGIYAAFLPPSIAGKVMPPGSADKLERIDGGKPSYKILIMRPGKETRIMCIEISGYAKNPGVDIFQSGVLLGTYDFETLQDCLASLNRIIRTHIWEKGKWGQEDIKRYTVNWLEKVLDLQNSAVCVEKDVSFLHSPTLIRSNRIDAVFTLIFEVFMKRANDPGDPLKDSVSAILANPDAEDRKAQLSHLTEKSVSEFLTAIKDCDGAEFDTFTDKEKDQLERERAGTVRKIVRKLMS